MKYGPWFLVLFVFFIFLIALFGLTFRVGEVNCLGVDSTASRQVCERLGENLRGKSLIFFDFENHELVQSVLLDEVSQERFYIKSFKKFLPRTVEYVFRSQPPLFRLMIDDETWLLDEEGTLKPDDQRQGLITISTRDKNVFYGASGELREQSVIFLVDLINASQGYDLKIENIVIDSLERIVVYTAEYPDVILDFSQNGVKQAKRMQQILSNIFREGNELGIREIDLRFELPVMRTLSQPSIEIEPTEKNDLEKEATDSAKLLIDSPDESLL